MADYTTNIERITCPVNTDDTSHPGGARSYSASSFLKMVVVFTSAELLRLGLMCLFWPELAVKVMSLVLPKELKKLIGEKM